LVSKPLFLNTSNLLDNFRFQFLLQKLSFRKFVLWFFWWIVMHKVKIFSLNIFRKIFYFKILFWLSFPYFSQNVRSKSPCKTLSQTVLKARQDLGKCLFREVVTVQVCYSGVIGITPSLMEVTFLLVHGKLSS
jgi:hypothetical protein